MEAIKEEGLAHLVAECQNDKGRTIEGIYLGKLFPAKSATWARNKKFLANLFRYGLVRSNLRDAEAERKKRAKTSSR